MREPIVEEMNTKAEEFASVMVEDDGDPHTR